jgi:hypothetical protein
MKISSIKNLFLVFIFLIGILFPIGGSKSLFSSILVFIVSLIIGLCYPFIVQLDFGMNQYIIERPKWSAPIDYRRPLSFAQFVAFLLVALGLGIFVGELLETFSINIVAISAVSIGLGTIINIPLAVKNKKFWSRRNRK